MLQMPLLNGDSAPSPGQPPQPSCPAPDPSRSGLRSSAPDPLALWRGSWQPDRRRTLLARVLAAGGALTLVVPSSVSTSPVYLPRTGSFWAGEKDRTNWEFMAGGSGRCEWELVG